MVPARRVRVLVTRPADQAASLVERLEARGYSVALCPLIAVEPLGDDPVDTTGYDWVVITSPNGAREFARRRRGPLPRVAAIGPGTAQALVDHGIHPDLVPRASTQEGLVAEFPRPAGRVLFAGADGARSFLPDALGADSVSLYRTIPLAPELPEADVAVLASASAARALAALETRIPVVSIGPETTRAAAAAGIRVLAEAERHDVDGLVAAVDEAARVLDERRR